MYTARYFCTILTKSGIPRQIYIKVLNIKFYGNPSSGSRTHTCGQTDRQKDVQTDGYDEGNGVFCYYANTPKISYIAGNEIILAPSCKFIIRMTDWRRFCSYSASRYKRNRLWFPVLCSSS